MLVVAVVDGSSLQVYLQPKSVGLVWGLAATWSSVCIHHMNRVVILFVGVWLVQVNHLVSTVWLVICFVMMQITMRYKTFVNCERSAVKRVVQ